jgi:iron complex transport system substrate-binding protein
MRIVSLIASATEIVCELGFESSLVGRSHECDFPPSVQRLPVCTSPRFAVQGSSADIDRRVKHILSQTLSVYLVDAEKLRELAPDVIVTQTQCEVCAVSEKDVQSALCDWIESRPQIVSLATNALADFWRDIDRVAKALGAPERGAMLSRRLLDRMKIGGENVHTLPDRPMVACIEWIEPLMSAGNWMPELVEIAGGKMLFGQAGQHSPRLEWEKFWLADPDVILVTPCGWDIAKTREEMPALTSKPEWSGIRAVRNGRVYLADGNQYFNRPGPRLVESLEILAEILHPEAFHFGHEGRGWVRYAASGSR